MAQSVQWEKGIRGIVAHVASHRRVASCCKEILLPVLDTDNGEIRHALPLRSRAVAFAGAALMNLALEDRMNSDLHMAEDMKNDSKGNLFVIFGEPDIELLEAAPGPGGEELMQVKINGVNVFDPATGQARSDDAGGIACWFVDANYNEESFFVRQAYFLGTGSDPCKALKTTLKAEIDEDAWATLRIDTSRSFPKPDPVRIAVKVINHLGDEAMQVLRA